MTTIKQQAAGGNDKQQQQGDTGVMVTTAVGLSSFQHSATRSRKLERICNSWNSGNFCNSACSNIPVWGLEIGMDKTQFCRKPETYSSMNQISLTSLICIFLSFLICIQLFMHSWNTVLNSLTLCCLYTCLILSQIHPYSSFKKGEKGGQLLHVPFPYDSIQPIWGDMPTIDYKYATTH